MKLVDVLGGEVIKETRASDKLSEEYLGFPSPGFIPSIRAIMIAVSLMRIDKASKYGEGGDGGVKSGLVE